VEFLFPPKSIGAGTFPMERNEAILCSKHYYRSQNYKTADSFTIPLEILQSKQASNLFIISYIEKEIVLK
jgi:hypothetical protein